MKKWILYFFSFIICFALVSCSTPTSEAAQLVIDEINELSEKDEKDILSAVDIEKAKELYNSLPDNQKEQVKNYKKLVQIEEKYIALSEILNYENTDFPKIEYSIRTPFLGISEGDSGIAVSFATNDYRDAGWFEYTDYLKSLGFPRSGKYNDIYSDSKNNRLQVVGISSTVIEIRLNSQCGQ